MKSKKWNKLDKSKRSAYSPVVFKHDCSLEKGVFFKSQIKIGSEPHLLRWIISPKIVELVQTKKKRWGGFNLILIGLSIVDICIPDDLRNLYSREIFSQVHKGTSRCSQKHCRLCCGFGGSLADILPEVEYQVQGKPYSEVSLTLPWPVFKFLLWWAAQSDVLVAGKLRLCQNCLSLQMVTVNLVEVCIWKKHCVFTHGHFMQGKLRKL